MSFCECFRVRTSFIVAVLLVLQGGLLAHRAFIDSPTRNEPGHLVAGLSHWKFQRFDLYRVNPPLYRLIAAIPVLAVDHEEDWSGFYDAPGSRPVFGIGNSFVEANSDQVSFLFGIARVALIPFATLGGLAAYWWARDLFGPPSAGLVAVLMWTFDPWILGHGGLVTPDVPAASCGILAGYLYWRWLRNRSFRDATLSGIALALAISCKYTMLLLIPVWVLAGICCSICCAHRATEDSQFGAACHDRTSPQPVVDGVPSSTSTLAQLCWQMLLALYFINCFHGFSETGRALGEFEFVSMTLRGSQDDGLQSGNRFRSALLESIPVPVPAVTLEGIDIQTRDFENPDRKSYLCGRWQERGWASYYLWGLAVKSPHGTQILVLLSLLVVACRGLSAFGAFICHASNDPGPENRRSEKEDQQARRFGVALLIALVLTIFGVVSLQTSFSRHVRYVLPAWTLLLVLTGAVGYAIECSRSRSRPMRRRCLVATVIGCASWNAVSVLATHPNELGYFNEAAGGQSGGFRYLGHSSLDWGQYASRVVESGCIESHVDVIFYEGLTTFASRCSKVGDRRRWREIVRNWPPQETILLSPQAYLELRGDLETRGISIDTLRRESNEPNPTVTRPGPHLFLLTPVQGDHSESVKMNSGQATRPGH
ncbi:MAG: glycosyltransferase family 39 protein [Planctomycetaceae bacterium]|nr:glycosyltransferase family 39 protein [Planctomycetaceae bacterium]